MNRLNETLARIEPADAAWRDQARQRIAKLTMPHWAMGRLLDLAVDLAGMTRSMHPPTARKRVVTMAADHGVTAQGVSLFPRQVTTQMVNNFLRGGACVNALARLAGAELTVVDMGVAEPDASWREAGVHPTLVCCPVANGTADMTAGPAMSHAQAIAAVEAGIALVEQRCEATDVFALGEMGIGNTTAAAAVGSALTGCSPEVMTGRGTGLDDAQRRHKVAVVERSLQINQPHTADGLDVLAKVGGFEIGGMAGVILAAAARRRPVVIDGFPCTAGALIAQRLAPACTDYIIAGHRSQEPGHASMLDRLGKRALLDLDLRLGEGTGAVLALYLLDAAVRILTEVATFEEAAVAGAVR